MRRKQPEPPALVEKDGQVLFEGYVCYFFGDDVLTPVKSLKQAAGKTVWYRTSLFDNIRSIEVPK